MLLVRQVGPTNRIEVNVLAYISLLPQIEDWIAKAKLDALVLGLGPTGWLARHLKRDLVRGLRLFGAHDVNRMGLPVHDLLIMDDTVGNFGVLSPDGDRHAIIVNSRPDRLWCYAPSQPDWDQYIHECMRPVLKSVQFTVLHWKECSERTDFRLGDSYPMTMSSSTLGCTTLAWHLGCRRIGVLGMDLVPGKHHLSADHDHLRLLDVFMCKIATEAAQKGGAILNLSPITSLAMFASSSVARIVAP